MIAGHRRLRACRKLGIETLRCEVVELDRNEATIFMVDSNLQRSKVLPSEKAFAYKMRMDAMRKQGKRSDLTCAPEEHMFDGMKSRDVLAKQVGESREQVRRYIRLTELIPELLNMVDEGKMGMRPAVEISYLPKDMQEELADVMAAEDCMPSHDQTIRMRKLLAQDKLTPESITAIMQEEKPNQREKIVLRSETARNLIPKELPAGKREEYIIKALEHYGKYRARQREKNQER